MTRDDVHLRLAGARSELTALGVRSLDLFGSEISSNAAASFASGIFISTSAKLSQCPPSDQTHIPNPVVRGAPDQFLNSSDQLRS